MIDQFNVTDGYKLGHISQYVKGTQVVYSNMTPRNDKYAMVLESRHDGKMVVFGIQAAVKIMEQKWKDTFFSQEKHKVVSRYARRIKNYLGPDHGDDMIEAMGKLHDVGYLPVQIKALPEGVRVGMQIPILTVMNTRDEFYWLTNYLETYLSCMIWFMCDAASRSAEYYKTSKHWGNMTGAPEEWLGIANHCFAARGHRGQEDAMLSGLAQLLFSAGSDTLWAIDAAEEYYYADSDQELIACSVNAFEHATATQRIAYYDGERESLRKALTETYPTGILSYVADSDDYFRVISEDLPALKEEILSRQPDSLGLCKFVARPDSGVPLHIICGAIKIEELADGEDVEAWAEDILSEIAIIGAEFGCPGNSQVSCYLRQDGVTYKATGEPFWSRHDKTYYYLDGMENIQIEEYTLTAEDKGTLQVLWEEFGGTYNEKGYKVLDPKVGLIYGEAINIHLQDEIYKRMEEMGFCVSNVLFGTGSWGFLENSSRDSYGLAIKGTHSIVADESVSMQKNPKTAQDFKKSAKGLLRVEKEDGEYVLYDEQTWEQEGQGELKVVFVNGVFPNPQTFEEIRERAKSEL